LRFSDLEALPQRLNWRSCRSPGPSRAKRGPGSWPVAAANGGCVRGLSFRAGAQVSSSGAEPRASLLRFSRPANRRRERGRAARQAVAGALLRFGRGSVGVGVCGWVGGSAFRGVLRVLEGERAERDLGFSSSLACVAWPTPKIRTLARGCTTARSDDNPRWRDRSLAECELP